MLSMVLTMLKSAASTMEHAIHEIQNMVCGLVRAGGAFRSDVAKRHTAVTRML